MHTIHGTNMFEAESHDDGSAHANTSVGPLDHALTAPNKLAKMFWWFMTFATVTGFVVAAIFLVQKYNNHDIEVIVELVPNRKFPAVTFCNLNPYKKSALATIPAFAGLVGAPTAAPAPAPAPAPEVDPNASASNKRKRMVLSCGCTLTAPAGSIPTMPTGNITSYYYRLNEIVTWPCAFTCCALAGAAYPNVTSRLAQIDNAYLVNFLTAANVITTTPAWIGSQRDLTGVYSWYDTASGPAVGPTISNINQVCSNCVSGPTSLVTSPVTIQQQIGLSGTTTYFDNTQTTADIICEYDPISATTTIPTTSLASTTKPTTTTTPIQTTPPPTTCSPLIAAEAGLKYVYNNCSTFVRYSSDSVTWPVGMACCASKAPLYLGTLGRLAKLDNDTLIATLTTANLISATSIFSGIYGLPTGQYAWYDDANTPNSPYFTNISYFSKNATQGTLNGNWSAGGPVCLNMDLFRNHPVSMTHNIICEFISYGCLPQTTTTTTTTTTSTTTTTATSTPPTTPPAPTNAACTNGASFGTGAASRVPDSCTTYVYYSATTVTWPNAMACCGYKAIVEFPGTLGRLARLDNDTIIANLIATGVIPTTPVWSGMRGTAAGQYGWYDDNINQNGPSFLTVSSFSTLSTNQSNVGSWSIGGPVNVASSGGQAIFTNDAITTTRWILCEFIAAGCLPPTTTSTSTTTTTTMTTTAAQISNLTSTDDSILNELLGNVTLGGLWDNSNVTSDIDQYSNTTTSNSPTNPIIDLLGNVTVYDPIDNSTTGSIDNTTSTVGGTTNSIILLLDNSTSDLLGNITLPDIFENITSSVLIENSTILALLDNSTLFLDNSTINLFGNTTIDFFGNTTIDFFGNTTIDFFGNSTIDFFGNTTIDFFGNTTIDFFGNSTIDLFGNSTIASLFHNTTFDFENITSTNFSIFENITTDFLSLIHNMTTEDTNTTLLPNTTYEYNTTETTTTRHTTIVHLTTLDNDTDINTTIATTTTLASTKLSTTTEDNTTDTNTTASTTTGLSTTKLITTTVHSTASTTIATSQSTSGTTNNISGTASSTSGTLSSSPTTNSSTSGTSSASTTPINSTSGISSSSPTATTSSNSGTISTLFPSTQSTTIATSATVASSNVPSSQSTSATVPVSSTSAVSTSSAAVTTTSSQASLSTSPTPLIALPSLSLPLPVITVASSPTTIITSTTTVPIITSPTTTVSTITSPTAAAPTITSTTAAAPTITSTTAAPVTTSTTAAPITMSTVATPVVTSSTATATNFPTSVSSTSNITITIQLTSLTSTGFISTIPISTSTSSATSVTNTPAITPSLSSASSVPTSTLTGSSGISSQTLIPSTSSTQAPLSSNIQSSTSATSLSSAVISSTGTSSSSVASSVPSASTSGLPTISTSSIQPSSALVKSSVTQVGTSTSSASLPLSTATSTTVPVSTSSSTTVTSAINTRKSSASSPVIPQSSSTNAILSSSSSAAPITSSSSSQSSVSSASSSLAKSTTTSTVTSQSPASSVTTTTGTKPSSISQSTGSSPTVTSTSAKPASSSTTATSPSTSSASNFVSSNSASRKPTSGSISTTGSSSTASATVSSSTTTGFRSSKTSSTAFLTTPSSVTKSSTETLPATVKNQTSATLSTSALTSTSGLLSVSTGKTIISSTSGIISSTSGHISSTSRNPITSASILSSLSPVSSSTVNPISTKFASSSTGASSSSSSSTTVSGTKSSAATFALPNTTSSSGTIQSTDKSKSTSTLIPSASSQSIPNIMTSSSNPKTSATSTNLPSKISQFVPVIITSTTTIESKPQNLTLAPVPVSSSTTGPLTSVNAKMTTVIPTSSSIKDSSVTYTKNNQPLISSSSTSNIMATSFTSQNIPIAITSDTKSQSVPSQASANPSTKIILPVDSGSSANQVMSTLSTSTGIQINLKDNFVALPSAAPSLPTSNLISELPVTINNNQGSGSKNNSVTALPVVAAPAVTAADILSTKLNPAIVPIATSDNLIFTIATDKNPLLQAPVINQTDFPKPTPPNLVSVSQNAIIPTLEKLPESSGIFPTNAFSVAIAPSKALPDAPAPSVFTIPPINPTVPPAPVQSTENNARITDKPAPITDNIPVPSATAAPAPVPVTIKGPEATPIYANSPAPPAATADFAPTVINQQPIASTASADVQLAKALEHTGLTLEDVKIHSNMSAAQITQSVAIMLAEVGNDTMAMSSTVTDVTPYILAMMPPELAMKMSYNVSEVIVQCVYNGDTCHLEDFKLFTDPNYGNCYTFNADGSFMLANEPGASRGLTVTYVVGNNDNDTIYLAGVRVVVHAQDEAIFPDNFGFNAPSNYHSAATLEKIHNIALASGKKHCVNSPSQVSDFYYVSTYNQEACLRSCYQKSVIDKCNCGDPRIPLPPNKKIAYCDVTQRNCVNNFYGVSNTSSAQDVCDCPEPCETEMHEMTLSKTRWSKFHDKFTRGMIANKLPDIPNGQFAKVELYYDSLSVVQYSERPAYELEDLLMDLSSVIGLCLGVSIISFFEVSHLWHLIKKKH